MIARDYNSSLVNEHVLTIGHSNHAWERFAELLQNAGIATIADVRSSPYSRFNPQFNRETLAEKLKTLGIDYLFLGRELGARSDDPACYERGRVRYDRLAQTERFRSGIERVTLAAQSHQIALMCAEKEPLECHRCLLVSSALVGRRMSVTHILADGRLEPHSATLDRLLDLLGLPDRDLFRSKAELIEDASIRQQERIAYRNEDMPSVVEVNR